MKRVIFAEKIKEKKWNKLDDGEKSLVIYINIININNDSLWYYPSWLLFIYLSQCHIRQGMLYCSRVSVVPFPLSFFFFSIFTDFFFVKAHFAHLFSIHYYFCSRSTRRVTFLLPTTTSTLDQCLSTPFLLLWYRTLRRHRVSFHFFKHQQMTLRSFPFRLVRSLFLISSVFFVLVTNLRACVFAGYNIRICIKKTYSHLKTIDVVAVISSTCVLFGIYKYKCILFVFFLPRGFVMSYRPIVTMYAIPHVSLGLWFPFLKSSV